MKQPRGVARRSALATLIKTSGAQVIFGLDYNRIKNERLPFVSVRV